MNTPRRRRLNKVLSFFDNDIRIGTFVAIVVVLALLATAVLYMRPPGRTTVAFETIDVSAVSTGQDVRVAGVSVGKVLKMELGDDTVKVYMEIEDDLMVGTESRVEVRMLTPVGGYAVTLFPLGRTPLGNAVIPANQVSVPYSIGDVLQAAPNVTDNVDGTGIDANLIQVADALQKNPGSIESIISGMSAVARVMDDQRRQVHTVATLASEYLTTFNGSREMVFDVIREIEIVFQTYDITQAGFNEAYRLLGHILVTVAPFADYYLDHRDALENGITQVRSMIEELNATVGPSIEALSATRDQLARWLTPEGIIAVGGGTLMASDICIPVPGRQC
ncbi:MlaD family protein [Rhodococcus sp. NPDC003382]